MGEIPSPLHCQPNQREECKEKEILNPRERGVEGQKAPVLGDEVAGDVAWRAEAGLVAMWCSRHCHPST